MSSPSQHAPKESSQSPATQCHPDQPSTSNYVPVQSTYLEAPSDPSSFLVPSTYGQISYEVEDSAGTFNYCYNPRHSMSKYLEDVDCQSSEMLDTSLDLLNFPAPASVPSNFSYLMGSSTHEQALILDSSSPPDEAQFSPPEHLPETIPLSAPMSSESQYVPSPSVHSEGFAETSVFVGQPSVSATLKNTEDARYRSPKNHDESWLMNAFYSSSEDLNSPDEWEMRKSAEDDVNNQLETDESDERASLVDRLFAMLERAEESDEGEERDTDENDVTLTRDSQPIPRAAAEHLSKQFLPEYQQTTPIQDIVSAVSQYSPQSTPMEYAADTFHPHTTYALPQASHPAAAEFIPQQYQQQHLPILDLPPPTASAPTVVYSQSSLQAAPPPPLTSYAMPAAHQLQQSAHQYFRPIPTDYLSEPQIEDNIGYSRVEPPFQPPSDALNVPTYGLDAQPMIYLAPQQLLDSFKSHEFAPQEHDNVPEPSHIAQEVFERSPLSSLSATATDPDVWESVSVRRSQEETQWEEEEDRQKESRPRGPPFEQKGPTWNKEILHIPPPPPPSPEWVPRENPLETMDPQSLVQQLAHETDRLEETSLREIANYDRQQELNELRKKMCDRFERFYPNLFSEEEKEGTDVESDIVAENVDETGDPEDGKVIRNGIQLTAKYLALWFPDKKERKEMIPWNILRKRKPIRLCFLDNRVGRDEYETFDVGEFVTTTGHMMFAYGDGPEAFDDTRLFVLDIVRQQMNMLLQRVWYKIMQTQERKVFTYSHIFALYKKHPIRLRRLVRYLVEQNRKRHMLYRVGVDQGRCRGQDYFENRMGVNETGATEVICLRKRAPHIYYALDALYKDDLEFLCEERQIQDCDPELAKIKMFIKRRNRHLSSEHKEILNYARRVSYCSRTGRLSAFRAHRFHEFLGFPDLQTDLIYILDFMAREIVMEVTYKAAFVRKREQEDMLLSHPEGFMRKSTSQKYAAESIELRHYEEGLRSMAGWRQNKDILFGAAEDKVLLSYGRNPIKWESDGAYNQREAAERRDFEKDGPVSRRTVYISSGELFEEHRKTLHGEYWDASPEELTKEAMALANAYAMARVSKASLEQPPIPHKWKQQDEKNTQDERERLEKLRAINRRQEEEVRLTAQLVKLMAKSSITDEGDHPSIDDATKVGDNIDFEKARKAIYTAIRRRKGLTRKCK
ncbi:hypothetical protein Y032_0022g552 [Ancylostoma ceylanicum]|uniref:Uncharacterized protein n=1 Tax=Ancylostoma ceylanicum TaxID=53326 RepID=A0A016UZR1_9BILA|nr:hypothetical protein Y032_0022g552 [Ancylostoma ceylanicum]